MEELVSREGFSRWMEFSHMGLSNEGRTVEEEVRVNKGLQVESLGS